MVSSARWFVTTVMLVTLTGCDAARILAAFPTPSRSHVISFTALTTELAARGHQVTVISSFPQKQPIANYTDIFVPPTVYESLYKNLFEQVNKSAITDFFEKLSFLKNIGTTTCEFYLEDPGVQKLIQSKDDQFDLFIVEVFFNECFLGFAHKLNVPVVGIVPNGGIHWMLEAMGNPCPYAYVPNPMHGFSDRMTFLERVRNVVSLTLFDTFRRIFILPTQDALMRKYFIASAPLPDIGDIERNTSVLLLNNHVSLGYPRPLLPNVIEVGGMHIKPGQKLPQDLQKYLDESKDGVVYFSMGSNLKGVDLPESKRKAFLEAFSKIKQRVLWKWEADTIPGQPDNVRLGKWLPQTAILEHPNVKLFITHGGLLSTQEAVYHAMPIIGIPVFADQTMNMKQAQILGFGLTLEFNNVTSESLQWALNTVLNEPSYRRNAKLMSARFRDQPRTPLETAVYWTEYVLRHNGAPHLRSAALDLSWYQYYLLDVIAVLALGLFAVSLTLYLIVKMLIKLVCGGKDKQVKTTDLRKKEYIKKQN